MSFLDFSNCEAQIDYLAKRYDPKTRQWLLKPFKEWFSNPDDSRKAFVLIGDAGIGKSVIAAVVAQQAKVGGNLAAAFFSRHNDRTRNDPRYLLGTIAYQLSNCNNEYDKMVGGVERIHRMLTNSELGVQELFTKLLEEPLSQCNVCTRQLVVIDALDETDNSSRNEFLDLIMDGFPLLPKWLVFFITSRPEDTVQYRLKNYNPVITICSGNNSSTNTYQQHIADIQTFLENKVNFSTPNSYSPEELTNQCNGMFLYAFFLVEMLKTEACSDDNVPPDIYDFFRKNFKRIHDKLKSKEFYQKLFGCFVTAPSPLPRLFISFLLQKESRVESLSDQKVIDVVSQFVPLRNTDDTFVFLHNLISGWLTNEKLSRELCVDKDKANKYFTNIIVEYLNVFLQGKSEDIFFKETSLVNYMLCVGFHFLGEYGIKEFSEIVFNCLTNYRFLHLRIGSNKTGIYSLIVDLEFSIEKLSSDATKKAVLRDLCSVLKRDKIILAGNHLLLHSCLSSSSSLVRNKVIPEHMSGPGLIRSPIKVPRSMESLNHIDCGAFSHDKKLFAAGEEQYLYLYDGLSFKKILGPVELFCGSILHLEFSPCNEFVFFGRLNKWFSVKEERVVERRQFSGNCVSYVWGSHICNGKYIAVNQRNNAYWRLPMSVIEWAKYELGRCPPNSTEVETSESKFKDFLRYDVVRNYAEIFENQIWNVQTGRPVLEETFLSQLPPFFFFWHIFPMRDIYLDEDKITIRVSVTSLSMWRLAGRLDNCEVEFSSSRWGKRIDEYLEGKWCAICPCVPFTRWTDIVNDLFLGRAPFHFQYSIAETSAECYSFINKDSEIFSKDKKWFLRRESGGKIALFEREIKDKNAFKNRSDLLSETQGVKDCVFTDDNDALVYSTTSDDLYAISLVTGANLQSISGSYPVYCSYRQDLGFKFSSTNESRVVLLRDLPVKFLVKSLPGTVAIKAVGVTFTSCDLFSVLFSNGSVGSWKIVDRSLVLSHGGMEFQDLKFFEPKFQARKCFFSHGGDLIVVDEGSRIVLLKSGNSTPIKEEIEGSVACLTFSADDSLILFCILTNDDDQYFYIWSVNTSTLTGPLCLDRSVKFNMHVDCCCFSSDNSKLFFCGASSFLILKHEVNNGAVTTLQKRCINSHPSDICSYCTISCDDKLLACCIANKILIYSVDDTDKFYKLPHQHFGQIQYCKFLGGNRYLISFGIDGLMFLFDLFQDQSIAYLRHDFCIGMAFSPNEDKMVCLESPDKISLIDLQRPEYDWISNLELPSKANHTPQGAHLVVVQPKLKLKTSGI